MEIHPHLVAGIVVIGGLLVTGTVLFHALEGWSFIDAFYFSGMTITTVGYGDLVPTHDMSKVVTVVYAILGISGMFFVGIGLFGGYFKERQTDLERRLRMHYARKAAGPHSRHMKDGKLRVRAK